MPNVSPFPSFPTLYPRKYDSLDCRNLTAKFFFFDAEKIVALAEINSPEQRRLLSKAYTEVLGIKKYEDLKEQLENIQDDYRKKSAKPKEKTELNSIIADIDNADIEIESLVRLW